MQIFTTPSGDDHPFMRKRSLVISWSFAAGSNMRSQRGRSAAPMEVPLTSSPGCLGIASASSSVRCKVYRTWARRCIQLSGHLPMKYQQYINTLNTALQQQDGTTIARLLACYSKTASSLTASVDGFDSYSLNPPARQLPEPWDSLAPLHCVCLQRLYVDDADGAYKAQSQCLSLFFRYLQSQSSWILVVLYTLLKDLRVLAEQADQIAFSATGKTIALEECARTVSKAFSLCTTDRNFKGRDSRRIGTYHVAGLNLKCYFKVNRPNLCKNIIRAVTADPTTPSLDEAPLSDQVTWRFYLGMLAFMNGDEKKADEELTWALHFCYHKALRNQELILQYLIPLRLLNGRFASDLLLEDQPRLAQLYKPFFAAIKAGDVQAYDERLEWAQPRLVGMGVYLTVERGREGCLRGLFKKVWIASEKSTRIPIESFGMALSLHGVQVDSEEVECMVANMIYRGYMKGYISHEKQMVVLSKAGAFPPLSSVG